MHQGRCECGAVAFDVKAMRDTVTFCHCSQCRRSSGHLWGSTQTLTKDVTFTEARGLKWFVSSEWAKRGFCGECGSSLFYQQDAESISISAGAFDNPTGLTPGKHIFCADKGDYYDIADDAPHIEKY